MRSFKHFIRITLLLSIVQLGITIWVGVSIFDALKEIPIHKDTDESVWWAPKIDTNLNKE